MRINSLRPERKPRHGITAAIVILAFCMTCAALGQAGSAVPGDGSDTSDSSPERSAPTLKVYAREIVVDVAVSDANGKPIRDLKQSDFTVFENGKPQPIHSFAVYDELPTPVDPPAPLPLHTYTNYQPLPETGPVNILLLDILNAQPGDLVHEQQAILDYVDRMPPGTEVAVFLLSTSGLHNLQPFTSDPAKLRRAAETRETEFGTSMEKWTRDWFTTDAIDQIAAYVARIHGRKNLLWFTPRMPILLLHDGGYAWADPDPRGGFTPPDPGVVNRLMDTFELLTSEQIAVYPVDPGGVQGLGMENLRAEAVAEGLGGVAYYNNNNLGAVIAKAIDNGSHFYTLSYYPPNLHDDGHFHSIKVAVNRPGARLVYRKGYNAEDPRLHLPTSGTPLLKAALESEVASATQVLFNVRVEPTPDPDRATDAPVLGTLARKYRNAPLTRFDVVYALQPRQVTFADGPNGKRSGSLEFDAAVYSGNRKLVTAFKRTTSLPLGDGEDPESDDMPMFQFAQQLDLPPGRVYLRVGILDRNSNKVGTIEVPLTVVKGSSAASQRKSHAN